MKWTRYIHNGDGRPVFSIKELVKLWGCQIALHRFVAADAPRRFHLHPAWAVRLVLCGGYVEELANGSRRTWFPGRIGIISPAFEHRIDLLPNDRSSIALVSWSADRPDQHSRLLMTRRDRIREKVMARVVVDPVNVCYLWTGPTSGGTGRGKNYPRMSLDGRTVAVHLVAWTNEHGFIPGKTELDHVCPNRLCVRWTPDDHGPQPSRDVTHKENCRRRDRARPAPHCEEVSI